MAGQPLVVGLRRHNSLTIPKLLLILEVVRHLKCHTVFAGQPPNSLSPATQALGVVVRGANRLVVFSRSHQHSEPRTGRPHPNTERSCLNSDTRLHLPIGCRHFHSSITRPRIDPFISKLLSLAASLSIFRRACMDKRFFI